MDDRKFMKDVKLIYHDCNMYGDKGYIGADIQLDLFETAHIRLECPYRINQKRLEAHFHSLCKGPQENRNALLTTDESVYDHQKLC